MYILMCIYTQALLPTQIPDVSQLIILPEPQFLPKGLWQQFKLYLLCWCRHPHSSNPNLSQPIPSRPAPSHPLHKHAACATATRLSHGFQGCLSKSPHFRRKVLPKNYPSSGHKSDHKGFWYFRSKVLLVGKGSASKLKGVWFPPVRVIQFS